MISTTRFNLAALTLRLSVGILMLFHGVSKMINGHDFITLVLGKAGLPSFLQYGVPLGEVIAPILLILGVYVKPSAILIAFTMFASIFLAFGDKIFSLNPYGGVLYELNLLFLFSSLALVFLGSGQWGLMKPSKYN